MRAFYLKNKGKIDAATNEMLEIMTKIFQIVLCFLVRFIVINLFTLV